MVAHKARFRNGAIPRSHDRGKNYLYFKQWLSKPFNLGQKDRLEGTLRVVTLAAMNGSYVEGTASSLGLCGQTIRNRLKRQDPSRFFQVNKQLVDRLRSIGALSMPVPLAIDTHDEMFYGDPSAAGVTGTRNRKGTNYAYKFATASVLVNGKRMTVAVVPFTTGPMVDHVRRLMDQVSSLGIKVKYLLFDRGYHSVGLIRYLESAGIKYVIHLIGRMHAVAGEDRSYTTDSHSRRKGEQATFRLVTLMGKGLLYAFATNMTATPKGIRKTFRRRWGIETSYRMIRSFLPRTTTKLYRIRVLYFYTAVLLYNLWVLLNFGKAGHVIVEAVKLDVTLFILATVETCCEVVGG